MDLNNIELPAFLVADLYPSSLIGETVAPGINHIDTPVVNEALPAINPSPDSPWKSLGGNLKNVLIVIDNQKAVHLTDNELTFLTGVLSACKLSLADVAIINLNNHPEANYKELVSGFSSKTVLLFDTEPASFGLPMSFPHYQIQPFAGISFLYAPSLKQLENDKAEKTKLWICLKRLFNL